jgi:MFS family permease
VWRFPIAFQNIFALITMATMPFLPETPRWLYSHGRKTEAVTVLARLMDTTEDSEQVQFIKNEMEEALELEKQQPSFSWKQLRGQSDLKPLRRLVLCFMVQFFQQFTGINVIVFYVTIVLEQNMGLSSNTSSLVAGFIQIAFWVGTLPPIYYLDKYGRRPTLLIGSIVLLISLVLFTAGIAVNTDSSNNLALAMLILFQITFGMSWNATPWIYAPEITPLQLRHVGSAVGVFSEWLCTFVSLHLTRELNVVLTVSKVIVQMTPTAVKHTGWKIYLLFVILTALSIPFVYFFLPEVIKLREVLQSLKSPADSR